MSELEAVLLELRQEIESNACAQEHYQDFSKALELITRALLIVAPSCEHVGCTNVEPHSHASGGPQLGEGK
jgi:hypothetical protein